MKVSVIIPWHRAEKWWTACEASIKRSVEVSGDGCYWEIVVVRDEEGNGVAWARNEGLKKASGDWIVWVDADDEVTEDWASIVSGAVRDFGDAEVIVFDHETDGVRFCWGRRSGYVSGKRFCRDLIADRRLKSYMWDKIFKKSFFERKFFKRLPAFEDYDFWTRYAHEVSVSAYSPRTGYRHIGRCEGLISRPGTARLWVSVAWGRLLTSNCKFAAAGALMRAIYYLVRSS